MDDLGAELIAAYLVQLPARGSLGVDHSLEAVRELDGRTEVSPRKSSALPLADATRSNALRLLSNSTASKHTDSPRIGNASKVAGNIEGEPLAASSLQRLDTQSMDLTLPAPHGDLAAPVFGPLRQLHRVAEVRKQQGVSERTVARRLGIDVKQYRELENPKSDLKLSELLALQAALEVPLIDLLEDRQELSRPVEERAKMIKIMKTAVALREAKSNPRILRMTQMLCEQLVDLMPELAEVSGWPQFGARRGHSAMGKAMTQPIDTSQLNGHE